LGTIAFEALDKMLKLKRRRGADYYLETELVVRRSTGGVRGRHLESRPILGFGNAEQ
jgi:hypothetical protein